MLGGEGRGRTELGDRDQTLVIPVKSICITGHVAATQGVRATRSLSQTSPSEKAEQKMHFGGADQSVL